MKGSIAEATIEKENPNVHVILVWPVMKAAFGDLDCSRVLVHLDYEGRVIGTPIVG